MIAKDPEALHRTQDSSKHVKWKFIFPEQLSPLHDAAEQRHVDCINVLIARGAKIDQICNNMTPLQSMIMTMSEKEQSNNGIEVVTTLLRYNASPNVTWDPRASRAAMLRYAAGRRYHTIMNLLLDYGADTEHLITDSNGDIKPFPCKYSYKTPLSAAINYLNPEGLKILLLRGANPYFNSDLTTFCGSTVNFESVPHFIIYHVFWSVNHFISTKEKMLAEAIKVLEVYKELGGNLWTKAKVNPRSKPVNILQILRKRPEVVEKLGPLPAKLEEFMRTPRTLMSLCRMSIVKKMGKRFWTHAGDLPLPNDILKYVVTHPDHVPDSTVLCTIVP